MRREQTQHLSRRSIAAFSLAALIRPAAAAQLAPSPASDDAALLDLGKRWAEAWDASVAHDRTYSSAMSHSEAVAHDEVGERLHLAETALFDRIMATSAKTIPGLAVKAQALARALDCEKRGIESMELEFAAAHTFVDKAAFSLGLDLLRLTA